MEGGLQEKKQVEGGQNMLNKVGNTVVLKPYE